jgi:hypothetical protein
MIETTEATIRPFRLERIHTIRTGSVFSRRRTEGRRNFGSPKRRFRCFHLKASDEAIEFDAWRGLIGTSE